MADNYIDLPVEGGGGGVTSLNGLSGALTLVAGSNITITPNFTGTITIATTGVITSINGDSTPAQTLTTGTTGTDFAIVNNGAGDHKFNLPTASAVNRGALSSTDWSTFNSKQAALTFGSISTSTTGVSIGSGANSTVGPNVTVNIQTASGSQPGLLSSADWTTFNSKQPAGSYITALTGGVTASGPGSAVATLTNSAVTGQPLTGFVSTNGAVVATDTILTAIDKLNGNDLIFYNDQSVNYTIVASDFNKIVRDIASTAITFSLTAPATLGAGWHCFIRDAGTGAENAGQLTITPLSGTIDGLASLVVYPGDFRLITTDGVNFNSRLLEGGYVQYTTSGATTFTVPTKIEWAHVELWGGGGGGASGRRGATATARTGGGGGGGGAYVEQMIRAADLGASVTVTIAALALGGASATVDDTNGAAGSQGNNSTFGALFTSYGGGGGLAGTAGNVNGGGGGGSLTAGLGVTGGGPDSSNAGSAFGGSTGTTNVGAESGYGGAAGGGQTAGVIGKNGGSAHRGGAGGGGGGSVSAANATSAGGAGGSGQGTLNGGGGAAGTAGGGSGGNGTPGPTSYGQGTAGGGGGGGSGTVGGDGGDGGIANGGGGGGASLDGFNSGEGGDGGSGLCRIWYG